MTALLLSPLSWFVVLAVLLAVVGRKRRSRGALATMLLASAVVVVLLCQFGANLLVGTIESRVPDAAACATAPAPAIVVLAAGLDREPGSGDDINALAADSIRRAVAGILLWQRQPQATLVFAGGGPFATSESALLQKFAEQLGVPAAMIRREAHSQTTWENAEQLHALVPALPPRIVLVSSAIHLPRALIAFRAAGFEPCPYASDRRYLAPGGIGYYLPQSSALRKSEEALHELVGEAVYRWRAAR
jgi:uncharacterized SAM-binding protein YcdF (DUF218 family)